ncbi:MAG: hypothetical protein M9953_12290 [Thermomicrobiales bacterium]|nr:hypothetical protein [Thermomicrobiales bacterium]
MVATSANLQVDLAPNNPRELALRNPVIPASGCFGYGQEYSHVIDIQRLGAFCSKGITMQPRSGNPMPRITETPAGMLNAIGLRIRVSMPSSRNTRHCGRSGTCPRS